MRMTGAGPSLQCDTLYWIFCKHVVTKVDFDLFSVLIEEGSETKASQSSSHRGPLERQEAVEDVWCGVWPSSVRVAVSVTTSVRRGTCSPERSNQKDDHLARK